MTAPPPTVSTLLLVEDEAMLRATQARGLAKLPNVKVLLAGTVAEAVEVLMSSPPDLLVSDIDLPDRSGIELLGELGRLGLKIPVIFVSAYLTAYRSQIPPHANVEVLEKPIGIDELRDVVRRRLGVAVEATPFGVPDYLQLAALGRHSVTIEAQGDGGLGRIVVVQGEVWLAEDAQGNGFDAFARLAFCRGTSVRCVGLDGVPETRQLSGSPESLLLEAARLADEAAAKSGAKSEFDELDLGEESDFGGSEAPPAESETAPDATAASRVAPSSASPASSENVSSGAVSSSGGSSGGGSSRGASSGAVSSGAASSGAASSGGASSGGGSSRAASSGAVSSDAASSRAASSGGASSSGASSSGASSGGGSSRAASSGAVSSDAASSRAASSGAASSGAASSGAASSGAASSGAASSRAPSSAVPSGMASSGAASSRAASSAVSASRAAPPVAPSAGASSPRAARSTPPPPVATPAPSGDSPPPTAAFTALREEGVEALLAHDYPRALRAFREALALKPGDKFIEANLMRLDQLGVT